MTEVRVETVEITPDGHRQISNRERATSLLCDRREDVQAAVQQAAEILSESAEAVTAQRGWKVSTMEATFGITLSTEAGAIIARASAEASFEVAITIERMGVE